MKNYQEFIKESDQQSVYLSDKNNKYGFYTNKYSTKGLDGKYTSSISNLNYKIKLYINKVYGPFGYTYGDEKDIDVNGLILSSEYLNKMVNNYTVFRAFITKYEIKDEITFYDLIESNFDDIYHYNGEFFKTSTLPILVITTRKGNLKEKWSLDKFKEVLVSKNIDSDIITPTLEEDVNGIDGKFIYNGREFTIQVKPFSFVSKEDDNTFKATSKGSLSLGVDYLVLYRNNDYIILKNPSTNKIRINSNSFVYNSENIVHSTINILF